MLAHAARALPFWYQTWVTAALLPDPGLVLEPQLDPLGLRGARAATSRITSGRLF